MGALFALAQTVPMLSVVCYGQRPSRAYGINDSSFAEWLCCIREAKLLRSCEAERQGCSPSRGQATQHHALDFVSAKPYANTFLHESSMQESYGRSPTLH